MERTKLKAWLCILLIACIDPVSGKHRLTASCMTASAIGGAAVVFTGGLAALETHQQLHPCNANVPEPSDPNADIVNGDFNADKGFGDDPMASHPVSDEEASCFMEMDLNPSHCAKSHMWNGFNQNQENAGSCFTACIPPSKPDDCSAEDWDNFNDKTLKKMALYPSFGPDGALLKTHNGMATRHPKCTGEYYPLGASAVDVTPGNTTDPAPANTANGRKLRRRHHRIHKLADKIKSAVHKAVSDVKTAAKKVVTYTKAHSTIIKKVVKKVLIIVAFVAVSVLTDGAADAIAGAAEGAEAVAGAAEGAEVAEGAADASEGAEGIADGTEDATTEGDEAAETDPTEEGDEAECTTARRLCEGNSDRARLLCKKATRKLTRCNSLRKPLSDSEFDFVEQPRSDSLVEVRVGNSLDDLFDGEEEAGEEEAGEDQSSEPEKKTDEDQPSGSDSDKTYETGDSKFDDFDEAVAKYRADMEVDIKLWRGLKLKLYLLRGLLIAGGVIIVLSAVEGLLYWQYPASFKAQNCFLQGSCGPTPAPAPAPAAPIQGSNCTSHYSCVVRSAGQANTHFCQAGFPTAGRNTCNACASCTGTNGVASSDGTGPCGYCGTVTPRRNQVELSSSNATNPVFANITACFRSSAQWTSANVPTMPLPVLLNFSKTNTTILVYRPVRIDQRWGKYKAYAKLDLPAMPGQFAYNTTFKVQPFDCFMISGY
jgi:hypothetical protein